ncbi:hypothetical protein ACI79J_10635 [Geodermatophilus sp. SYSU D01062]
MASRWERVWARWLVHRLEAANRRAACPHDGLALLCSTCLALASAGFLLPAAPPAPAGGPRQRD